MPRAALAALPLLLAVALLAPAAIAAPPAAACTFVGGFAALHELAPDVVGACTEPEHHDPASGDALQSTTRGLLVWRKADNWTAFTDGSTTWINGPYGLQSRPNDRRFAWEPPVLPLFEELRGFSGDALVPSEVLPPFVDYAVSSATAEVDRYGVGYGEAGLGGNWLAVEGSLGRRDFDLAGQGWEWCTWSGGYCDSRTRFPDSQFDAEAFDGLTVNGSPAVVWHNTVPNWVVQWYDPARGASYTVLLGGDAADRLATGISSNHRVEAERLASIASQLVSLRELTIYSP